ncbi:hypothetical protein PV341_23280 [Streptomyces sp. PA03-1a]|nr:hypothetical protein [Streptomyces sp. PA03-1a]MDX2813970.1 hypothetical protein [Streptomyces sp. PA03-5A]
MSSNKSPLDHMRTVVTLYDRLGDDPQAQETLLRIMGGIDHDMVAAYREVLRDTDALKHSRRPVRNPNGRQLVTTVTLTVQLAC